MTDNLATAPVAPDGMSVRCFDGREIHIAPRATCSIRTDVATYRFDLDWINLDYEWGSSAFRAISHLLMTRSIDTALSYCRVFRRFAKDILLKRAAPDAPIGLGDAEVLLQVMPISYWDGIQSLLRVFQRLGLGGVDNDLLDFLDKPAKWEEAAEDHWYLALLTNDPRRGALTDQEFQSVYRGIIEAYQAGRISEPDYALVMFIVVTGVRPVQIARLKVRDVRTFPGAERQEVILSIPLAKGKMQAVPVRWRRRAPTQLVEILLQYIAKFHVRSQQDAPFFVEQSVAVSQVFQRVFAQVDSYSKRLGEKVPITPYRFRYTMATRALADGGSDHEVARLLTHRSTYCIKFYRASMPMLQRPIRKAVGAHMDAIAGAFTGKLLDSLDDATRKNDPKAVIRDFERLMGQKLGACGTLAACYQNAPIACLVCIKFEPLRSAPWQDLRALIVAERESEKESRVASILDPHLHRVDQIISRIALDKGRQQ